MLRNCIHVTLAPVFFSKSLLKKIITDYIFRPNMVIKQGSALTIITESLKAAPNYEIWGDHHVKLYAKSKLFLLPIKTTVNKC